MELRDAFEVPADPDEVWRLLIDVPRVVPLMPGAELTDSVDDHTWKGRMHAKLGPIRLSFGGTVSIEQRDDTRRRAVLRVRASESKGKGIAQATVTSDVTPISTGTRVEMLTDLSLSGAVAQYGSGLIADVAKRMTEDFARNIAAALRGESPSAADGGSPTPISGLSLAADLARGALRRIRGSDGE